MKKEDLKKEHFDFLNNKYSKIYNMKFGWADALLIESMINTHVSRVIENMDDTEYLKDSK